MMKRRLRSALIQAGLMLILMTPVIAAAEPTEGIKRITGSGVLPAGLPFSDAVQVGEVLYLSGQIAVVPGTLEMVPGGIKAQSHQVMKNIRQVLNHAGLDMNDVFKCTVMLADMDDWPAFNEIYASYFSDGFPARSAFGAAGLAVGARLEVECMAKVTAQ